MKDTGKTEVEKLEIREKKAFTEQIEVQTAYEKQLHEIDIKARGQEIIRRNIEACNSAFKVWKDEEKVKAIAKKKLLIFIEELSI